VPDRVGEEELLDDHRVGVRRLNEDDMLARDWAQQPDVPLAVGETPGVLLERDIDETDRELTSDPASQRDGRGAADDLHGGPGRVVWDVDISIVRRLATAITGGELSYTLRKARSNSTVMEIMRW